MTHLNDSEHVYHRDINLTERTSLSVVASLINASSKVLDLGTGSGSLGHYLTANLRCTVDGVTFNAQEAALARTGYRRVEVADLEQCQLQEIFKGEQYDYIVCADVLEHLKKPESVLLSCRSLLAPTGKLILSIPNAAYCGLIGELMSGEFTYREEGLLDRTHLRFFTRKSLLRFLAQSGWISESVAVLERPLNESEFCAEFDRLPPAVSRYLLATPDAMTYQFVVSAAATENGTTALGDAILASGVKTGQAVFSAQLYLGVSGQYQEGRKLVGAGIIGSMRQTLAFTLPATGPAIDALRFDPADRPGFLHLYQITLRDAREQPVWTWQFGKDGLPPLSQANHHQLTYRTPSASDSAALAFLHGDDPWIELPLQAFRHDRPLDLRGGTLEVELGWPMSADYLALADVLTPLQQQAASLDSELIAMRQNLAEALARENQHTAELQNLTQTNADAHARLTQLQSRLSRIEQSTLYRATRPIAHLKRRFADLASSIFTRTQAAAPTTTPGEATHSAPRPAPVVDVIVPVYRGLADTRRCIESVLTGRCQTDFRLLLINDASPEPETANWLRETSRTNPRIILIENTENLGFVATVNRGMSLSMSNDVVLLNSDTEVANDWLDRLRKAAYCDARVGSVTPFSNNATICSYPQFCENNPSPAIGTAALDQLFADCNAGEVVDVPTGVGFCMYIRRACLQEIGLFDVENFGKGYGEENDFCVRAANAGWRNLHALDTFVLHAGGISFGESKRERELAAMETLRRLHPDYEPSVHRFLEKDPAQSARHRVALAQIESQSSGNK